MSSNFFAMISRMKYIDRWSLMRNSHRENLSEHSMETACVAHALAIIGNKRFGRHLNAERAALLGLYHDAPECLTGDMPTPVKYYSEQVREAYKTVEDSACENLVAMLPEDLRAEYLPLFYTAEADGELWELVKAADKICALIKCIEEAKAGNGEFSSAADSLAKTVKTLGMPEADVFVDEFLPGFEMTLDELKRGSNF